MSDEPLDFLSRENLHVQQVADSVGADLAEKVNERMKEKLADRVAVGDLASKKVGSGARKNSGKDPLDFIPVSHWAILWNEALSEKGHYDVVTMLYHLADWQEGEDESIYDALLAMSDHWEESIKTFTFGAKKYAKWNWAKGMEWSIPVGCILRHTRALVNGETIDADSGTTHAGCITCNLHMLAWYTGRYPQLDDRPIFEEET